MVEKIDLLKPESIKWLHVELSTRCNAWCPACPRNKNGYGLADDVIEEDLPTKRLVEVMDQLPGLEIVQLCGNLGDPIVAKNILEVVHLIQDRGHKIQIHTNGSMRTTQWWSDFGRLLSGTQHDIWFGIDGLKGVHEIYRQGTDFQKIIDNAQAFIQAGGYATWQFIPYAHNEHQVVDCLKMSQDLGFAKFKLVPLYRDKKLAKHYQTGEEFDLLPPIEYQSIVQMVHNRKTVKPESCMHLNIPSVYLAANGRLSTCCYFRLIKTFDTVQNLLYNQVNLEHNTCVINCGS